MAKLGRTRTHLVARRLAAASP
uniref:Uncharacterized protein n=1 Tax=Arundo donax TaxID=35708 RepID=A0A0A9FWW4_ARUDO